MQILLKQVKIIDPTSSHHGQIKDILVQQGKITSIRNNIPFKGRTLQVDDAQVSPGWIDIGTWIGDPGFEQVEVLETASQAANHGGYTSLVMLPNTAPAVDNKSAVEYIRNQSSFLPTHIYPTGAVSQGCHGDELAELMDMHSVGALAFTDGMVPVQNSGLLLKALEYVKLFNGLVINSPHSRELVSDGQIHEGEVSVALGLRGIPALSEVMMVKRDIDLARYAGSRLHLLNVSTAESVDQVRKAKQEGLDVTCSVAVTNLLCTDHQVSTFDVNYKVMPPLRGETDRKALIAGLRNGIIDFVTSNHRPVAVEQKNLEFAFADFGISGLETAYHVLLKALGRNTSPSRIIEKLAITPRRIFNLAIPTIERNQTAELTIYSQKGDLTLTHSSMRSRAKNNPFLNEVLPGRVIGVISKNQCQLFD